MKSNTHYLSKLAVFLLTVCPTIASAAATDAGTDYMTDKSNSYVQDQSNKTMENLNSILCSVSAMNPSEMVNLGNYIALIDDNICNPNDGGGSSSTTSTGAKYAPTLVNSTRANDAAPMIAKVWLEESDGPGGSPMSIFAYLSATQAPSASDPYGRFRLDYCGKPAVGSCSSQGFINSTASGLAFFSSDTGNWGMGGVSITQTLKLQLNASSTTTGSGWLSRVTIPTVSGEPNANFLFAYNADYFLRSDSEGAGGVCFDRDPANAAESVWRYGLYNSTTGERIERNSGFPIEYTDTNGATMNGYVGYWGMNAPTTVNIALPVYQVTYGSGSSPTKTPYTLLQTNGKLIKFSKATKTLDDLDKVKFQFWPQSTVAVTGGTVTSGTGGCSGYEVYWDKTNFIVTGQQDSTNNCNIKTFASPWTMTVANMRTAAPWGLNGWSQMIGGDFGINQTGMASLSDGTPGNTPVVLHTQDIVYPSSFASTFPNGLVCIENCPTKADIDASNANCTSVLPYVAATTGWDFPTGRTPYVYTLNATTGNLIDGTGAAVISTASQTSGTAGCNNNNGIQSGRLAIKADLDANTAVTERTYPFAFVANQYLPIDIDQLDTYYQWQTGGNNWNQLSVLKDSNGGAVAFDPPLNVDFVVPAGAKYGGYAGATFTMQYGGFGNLWGIPSTCIDAATNTACLPNNATPQQQQRWTPHFSIPAGSSVTVSGGTTTYLVKALEKEVRLGKVETTLCTDPPPAGAGLVLPLASSVTLPDNTSWSDPSSASSSTYVGVKPTFTTTPAPQVIHGVKMY